MNAVNVKIKDNFKEKISGNIRLEGGINDKFLVGANLFNFKKGPRLNIISSYNNKGKQSISNEDLLSIKNKSYELVDQSLSFQYNEPDEDDFATFLKPNIEFSENDETFAGLNFNWRTNDKLKIDGYSYFSSKNQRGKNEVFQDYFFNSPPLTIVNQNDFTTKNVAILTNFKTVYILNKYNTLRYYFNFANQNNTVFDDILNQINEQNTSIAQKDKITPLRLKNVFYLESRISSSAVLENQFSYLHQTTNQSLNINSNAPLFTNFYTFQLEQLTQNQRLTNKTLNLKSKLTIKRKDSKNNLQLGLNNQWNNVGYQFDRANDSEENNLNLRNNSTYFFSYYSIQSVNNFEFNLGGSVHYFSRLFQKELENQFLFKPNIQLYYRIKQNRGLLLSYNYDIHFPILKKLLPIVLINNFQSINQSSEVNFNNQNRDNTINLVFYNLNFVKKLIFAKVSYSFNENILSTDTSFMNDLIVNRWIVVPKARVFDASFTFNSPIRPFSPFRLNLNTNYSNTNDALKINTIDTDRRLSTLSASVGLNSNNLSPYFDFSIGTTYNNSRVYYPTNGQDIYFENFISTLKMDGQLFNKKIIWKGEIELNQMFSETQKIQYNRLNLLVQYKTPFKKLDVELEGQDLLNLTSNQLLQVSNNQLFYEEKLFFRFPGFLTLNVNYRF